MEWSGLTVTLTAEADDQDLYQWTLGDGGMGSGRTITYTYLNLDESPTITLLVRKCKMLSQLSQTKQTTSIMEKTMSTGMIYPNPVRGRFKVSNGFEVVSIYTLDGKEVAFYKEELAYKIQSDVVGIFIVKLSKDHKDVFQRILVE
jgi:carbohydrate-selective porin OprB